jgi:hypothetical protein
MVALSRTVSLGVLKANPYDSNASLEGLTEYEVLRNRRKEALHVQIQLALLNEGVVLDERVLRGFDGKCPVEPHSTGQSASLLEEGVPTTVIESTAAGGLPLHRSLRKKTSTGEEPRPQTSPQQPRPDKVCLLNILNCLVSNGFAASMCRVVRWTL